MKISIEVGEAFYSRMADLRNKTGSENNGEVIREALRLYEYFVTKHGEGARFLIESDVSTGPQEVTLFASTISVVPGSAARASTPSAT